MNDAYKEAEWLKAFDAGAASVNEVLSRKDKVIDSYRKSDYTARERIAEALGRSNVPVDLRYAIDLALAEIERLRLLSGESGSGYDRATQEVLRGG